MIKLLGDRVLVRVNEVQQKTSSGIYIPTKQVSQRGEVLEVGPGRILENGETMPLDVNKGDEIIFEKFVGHPIELDDQTLLIIHEGDIIAVL